MISALASENLSRYAVTPRCTRLSNFETGGETLEIKFDLTDIEAVQESQSEKAERLVNLVQAGIMTAEEARAEMGL